jgi:hypothetical protein
MPKSWKFKDVLNVEVMLKKAKAATIWLVGVAQNFVICVEIFMERVAILNTVLYLKFKKIKVYYMIQCILPIKIFNSIIIILDRRPYKKVKIWIFILWIHEILIKNKIIEIQIHYFRANSMKMQDKKFKSNSK